ncbi:hypothetical protein PLICRDRAFT_134710 [Plicaturopsis crispa FD-325 SS-3]|nr:hypothetical protein PLICRDRAFT_134710 [Plicaturopsis crispa FD-325 SS-3]
MSTVYLISGASRGIGLGFVSALARRENAVVFAGARNPSSATQLQSLAKEFPSKVHVVKLTSGDKADNEAAVAEVKRVAGKLDVVIANAGISDAPGRVLKVSAEAMSRHFDVNVNGTLVLFQAAYPLLKESPKPKFIPVSSGSGSITGGPPMKMWVVAYGASKAALNFLAREIHVEHEDLICFPICPGPVKTDMAAPALAEAEGFEGASKFSWQTVDESVARLLKIIDNATRENEGGQFVNHTGGRHGW